MDYFYAQVEEREDPSLKNIPVAIGGNAERRGVICTSNYIARTFGVRSAMSTHQALKKCPKLKVLHPNFSLYKEVSQQIREIFLSYSEIIEPLSLDEAYIDVTGSPLYENSATWIAQAIRKDILQETKLTASAGIGPNKFLAKVASDWNKPNGQFTVAPKDVAQFVHALPVKKIFGVGPVMEKKLHDLKIFTCSDLQKLTLEECVQRFGKMGAALFERARGIDSRDVDNQRVRKSLSVEETFAQDLKNIEECHEALKNIHAAFLTRLEKVGDKRINATFVKIKFADFTQTTVEHVGNDLYIQNFFNLLVEGYQRGEKPVRLLGLGVRFKESNSGEFEQLPLL